jgi:hypothetical protein
VKEAVATDKQPATPPSMSALSADASSSAVPLRTSTRARRARVMARAQTDDVGALMRNDENLSSAVSDDEDDERRDVPRRRQQRAAPAPSKASLANVRLGAAAGTPRTHPVWPALPKFYSKNDGVQVSWRQRERAALASCQLARQVRDEDAAAELLFELACRSGSASSSETAPANTDDSAWRRASFVVVV